MSLDVGRRCAVCPAVDFLPVLCSCNQYFCKDHIQSHFCQNQPTEHTQSFGKRELCALADCNNHSIHTCANCSSSYCIEHRHADSHNCPSVSSGPPQAKKTTAVAQKTVSKPPTKIPTNPAKLAQYRKIQLMKMRHHAVPVDPKEKNLPIDQRHHFRVLMPDNAEKAFWAPKSAVTGKVVDLLAVQMHFLTPALDMFKCLDDNATDMKPVQYSEPFSSQIEEGTLVIVKEKCKKSDTAMLV